MGVSWGKGLDILNISKVTRVGGMRDGDRDIEGWNKLYISWWGDMVLKGKKMFTSKNEVHWGILLSKIEGVWKKHLNEVLVR